jgi:hypothetical protein
LGLHRTCISARSKIVSKWNLGDKTMVKLERYELDFSRGIEYFKSNLEDTNELSSMVIKSVCFKSGRFFTLLPNNTNINNINEFRFAGIAINVRSQVNDIIFNKLMSDNRLICIFDDVTTDFRLEYRDPLFLSCGLVCEKEIYYLVTRENASRELIDQCFRASNAIWHSLCILTKYRLNENKKLIDLSEMKEVCLNAGLILAGAYDGEGYVFWENSTNEFLNTNDNLLPEHSKQSH